MSEPEVWLRGALAGFPPLLQPVVHSLLQCQEEVHSTLSALSPEQIARQVAGAASVGYHVRHAIGSLDRLFTYARSESLSATQLASLAAEKHAGDATLEADRLMADFDEAVERALDQLRRTADSSLLEARLVGRAKLPSTVIGLLFHAAEHTQRHVGQMATTAKMIRASS
jgi:uncharacterized damage-inducible protein DinB